MLIDLMANNLFFSSAIIFILYICVIHRGRQVGQMSKLDRVKAHYETENTLTGKEIEQNKNGLWISVSILFVCYIIFNYLTKVSVYSRDEFEIFIGAIILLGVYLLQRFSENYFLYSSIISGEPIKGKVTVSAKFANQQLIYNSGIMVLLWLVFFLFTSPYFFFGGVLIFLIMVFFGKLCLRQLNTKKLDKS